MQTPYRSTLLQTRWIVLAALVIAGCSQSTSTASNADTAPKKAAAATTDAKGGRADVHHATDPDAANINLAPQDTTLAGIASFKSPSGFKGDISDYQDKRIAPFETTVWRVKATVKSVQHRKDGDYYIELQGADGSKGIVEVPDPSLCKGSPLEKQITDARKDIEDRFHPTDAKKEINQDATIEGVGFLGWKGKPGGGGQHGPRLMPGLGFDWGKKG